MSPLNAQSLIVTRTLEALETGHCHCRKRDLLPCGFVLQSGSVQNIHNVHKLIQDCFSAPGWHLETVDNRSNCFHSNLKKQQ